MSNERVFAVIGLGHFGRAVCRAIAEKGGSVIAVDNKLELLDKVKDVVAQAVLVDTADEYALKSLPLDTIDVAIVAISDSLDDSIISTALMKKYGVPYIVARAVKDIHADVLKQVGATEVINIETSEGQRLGHRLVSPDILDRIALSGNQILAELVIPDSFVGKKLTDLAIRKNFNLNVISIKRIVTQINDLGSPTKEEQIIAPDEVDDFERGDIVIVIGKSDDVDSFKGG